MKLQFYSNFVSNNKFHDNPLSRSRVVVCGQMDGRTDMTKLVVTFRSFANALKEYLSAVQVLPVMSLGLQGRYNRGTNVK
jgi:hypothetical protein